MSTPALNPLVEKIRGKYPGAYGDMDDATLTKAVLAKYPQYEDLARPNQATDPSLQPHLPGMPGPVTRGAEAFGAAAGDLFQAGSSMRGGGVPGESFTPQIGSPAEKLAKSGDWRGAVKEATNEKLGAEPGLGGELKGAVTGLGSMIASPIQRAAGGDIAGGIGEAAANYPALIGNPEAKRVPEVAQAGVRTVGRGMEAHPYAAGHLAGAAIGEAVGHPYLGFIGGRFLERPIKSLGSRLSRVGTEPPGGPFRDVPEPVPDPFRETQPVTPQTAQPVGASIARPSEIPAPIRMGPGQIPPDIIAPPNPRILAGNQGIRTTPIGLLPASVEGGIDRSAMMQREVPPPVIAPKQTPKIGRPELLDDDAMREAMNADLESHGAQARREVNQERRARNDVSVPKWKMAAEAKARQLMDEAQKKAEDRAINRELGKGIPKQAKPKIAKPSGGDEDLTPILKKSLAAVKKKKV